MTMTRSARPDDPFLDDAEPPARRRRWPLVVLALVALALAGGVTWFSAYQPLSSVAGGFAAGLTLPGGGHEAVSIDNAYGEERRIVHPEPGDEIGMEFPLGNGGPLGVTILRIDQPFNPTGTVGDPLHQDETSAGHAMRATDFTEAEWVDVAPFSLPAGATTQIRLTFDVLDCATYYATPGKIDFATTVPVTYRVLGLTRTVQVALPYAISIEDLPRCPS